MILERPIWPLTEVPLIAGYAGWCEAPLLDSVRSPDRIHLWVTKDADPPLDLSEELTRSENQAMRPALNSGLQGGHEEVVEWMFPSRN